MKARALSALFVVAGMLAALLLLMPHARLDAQIALATSFNRCIAVTTSDTVDLAPFTQAGNLTGMLYVGGAGNVTAVMPDGSTVLFTAPPVGAQLPIAIRRVNATNTTATVLVACYRV